MSDMVTPYANSLFEQPWWLDIVAPGQWHEVLVKDKQDHVVARMPYVSDGKRIFMPKLTQNLGIWMDHSIVHDYGKQKDAINALFAQLPECKSVTHTLSSDNQYILPFRWLGYSYEPTFSYRLPELHDLDGLYSRLNKTAKKNIKYARNKVTISDQLDMANLWSIQEKTYQAQKRKNPMDRDLLQRIITACEENGHGKYMEARDAEGNLHCCSYFVYDEKVCYYLISGSDPAFRSSGAQSLILWEGIQFAAKHSEIFDFEGSSVEGIENFFRQFGGVCTPLYTIRKTTFLDEVWLAAKPRIKRMIGYKI